MASLEFGSLARMGAVWVSPVLPSEAEYRRLLHDWLPAVFQRHQPDLPLMPLTRLAVLG